MFYTNEIFGLNIKKKDYALAEQNMKEADVAGKIERENYFNLGFLNTRKTAIESTELEKNQECFSESTDL